jgi:hypothetical protein
MADTTTTTTTATTTLAGEKKNGSKERVAAAFFVCSFQVAPKQEPQTEMYLVPVHHLRDSLRVRGQSYWTLLKEKPKRGLTFANCVPYMFHAAFADPELVAKTAGSHEAFEYLYGEGATTQTPAVNRDLLLLQKVATGNIDHEAYDVRRTFYLVARGTTDILRVASKKRKRPARASASSSSSSSSDDEGGEEGEGDDEEGEGGRTPVEDDEGKDEDDDDDDNDDA